MARTRAEDERRRNNLAREQAERIAVVFDCHTGGLSRRQLAEEAEVPEERIGHLMVWMRKHIDEFNSDREKAVPKCLRIGGEWIYGWAEVLDEHLREHHKRLKAEAASLSITIDMKTQSIREEPESLSLKRQLASAQARLIIVEQEIEEASALIKSLRREGAA